MDSLINNTIQINNNFFKIYRLDENCYHKNYFKLLPQLTDYKLINDKYHDFNEFVNSLNDNHIILVIENNQNIIATCTILIEKKIIRNYSSVAHVEDVIVDKNFRKFGLGKILIQKSIEIAKFTKCYKCILDCDEEIENFYKKNGFIKKGSYMALYL